MYTLGALLTTLTLYLLLTTSALGWGSVVARLLGMGDSAEDQASPRTVLDKIWLGWCWLIILLQLCHFAIPLSAGISLLVYGIGVTLAWYFWKQKPDSLAESGLGDLRQYGRIVWIGLGAGVVYIALRSMNAPQDFDSGLYHFNAVRWINEYAIVPGLGNLHNRLAFNCSYFPFVASLNFYPWFQHGSSIALSWMLVLVFAECWLAAARVFHAVKHGHKQAAFDILPALLVPYLLFVVSITDLASPQPNRASFLLRLAVFICLWRNLTTVDRTQLTISARMVLVLAVTLVTIKVNNGIYSAIACLVVLVRAFILAEGNSAGATLRRYGVAVVIGVVTVGIWFAYGYVTSGYPLFPSTALALPTDWIVWQDDARQAMAWIYSWARQPFTKQPISMDSSDWMQIWVIWLIALSRTTVLLPVAISLVASFVFVVRIAFRGYRSVQSPQLLLGLVPLLAGLAFWFRTAPDPRFAEGLFWLLPAVALSIFVCGQRQRQGRDKAFYTSMALMALPLIFNLSTVYAEALAISGSGWKPLPVARLEEKVTEGGLKIYVTAEETLQVWDSPLPSTPYFRKSLQLRGQGIQSGFKTCREIQY